MWSVSAESVENSWFVGLAEGEILCSWCTDVGILGALGILRQWGNVPDGCAGARFSRSGGFKHPVNVEIPTFPGIWKIGDTTICP